MAICVRREEKKIVLNNIHFIINALSPDAKNVEKEIARYFVSEEVPPVIKTSKYKGHTIELATASIIEGAEIVVACGGDGTVNEVARCLVNTRVKMGVLPIGSGNGLARHLRIPIRLSSAMELLKKCEYKRMDVGQANDRYFFCNISVAFSAQVIHCYDEIPQRGFLAYSRAFLSALSKFKYDAFDIEEQSRKTKSIPFVLLFSNTDQLGYNRSLTPNASLFDGKLDMVKVEKSNPLLLSAFMFFAFFKKFPPFAKVTREQLEHIRLSGSKRPLRIQLDGEKVEFDTNVLDVKVLPKSLQVIC